VPKFPKPSDIPNKPKLYRDLPVAVVAILRRFKMGDQDQEIPSAYLETELKLNGISVRGTDLNLVMERLMLDGLITARKSGLGSSRYVQWISPRI
jgi:hypothetical protein